MSESETGGSQHILVGLFEDGKSAEHAIQQLIERDYPMDQISMLGRPHGIGDDPLGVYYHTVGERMKGWGKLGAFWGGLWGLLAGAAGMFVLPGLGPVLAAGPVVEALASAAAGAAAGGGAMAAGGAVSQLAVALRTSGIPEEKLDELHRAIEEGHYLLLMRCRKDECPDFRHALSSTHPREVDDFPFGSLV
jgi:hypothetical protein